MHTLPMLSAVGLSLVVMWGTLTRGAGTDGESARGVRGYAGVVSDSGVAPRPQPEGESGALPFEDADGQEMAGTERKCKAPAWGESPGCAAFALASGASVEITLLEVKDTDGKDQGGEISFRLWDVKGQTTVDGFSLPVGAKFTYVNKTDGVLDLVVHARGQWKSGERNLRFTYEKK